jgi:hypothetical protein
MSGASWGPTRAQSTAVQCPVCRKPARKADHTRCESQETTVTTADLDPFAEVPRDRFGRPLIIPADGGKPVAYTRCTTYVGCLEDTFNLAKWQQRMVAQGLAARPDLLLAVSAHSDDKKKLDQLCADALEAAKGSAAATTGTALHRLSERVDRGEDVTIPDVAKDDIAAYLAATGRFGKQQIEVLTVHDDLKVAGTPDRVLLVDDEPVIADLKTGSIDFGIGKIAMQLALYSRSSIYDINTGARKPLHVNQDRALVIHLPAGTGQCNLVWVDIQAGWEAVQLATQVRAWRARKDLATPYAPVDWIAAVIEVAGNVEALTDLWRDHADQWQPHHTALAAARKKELTDLPVAS